MFKICNLQVAYDQIIALNGVDLEVSTKNITCLIGANGAGKTSLLLAISGLIPYKCDELTFNGKPVPKKSYKVVEMGIIHVPEGRDIFTNLTVEENLLMGAYRRRDIKNIHTDLGKVYEIFPRLKERHKQIAGTLSGGEQQMLAFGRGLMASPSMLLLDEPSLGLAPNMIELVFTAIKKIAVSGVPILLVEQNAARALEISSKAYLLENGRIVLSGTGLELLENPKVREAYLGNLKRKNLNRH